jgi:ribosomal-protein-alanine N-acetyltransferase
VLRDFEPGDLDAVAAIAGDDRVTTWLSFESRDRDGSARMLQAAIAAAHATPRSEYYLAVTLPTHAHSQPTHARPPGNEAGGSQASSGAVVGFARLALGGVRAAKLGYAIHADHWGHGYATDAARTLCDFGFDQLGLHRITAAVGPDNHASLTVLTKLGFSLEGRLRDHVFTNGAWRDSLLYSLLTHERPDCRAPTP